MKKLFLLSVFALCLLASRSAHAASVACPAQASKGNITCHQMIQLSGGLCGATLSNYLTSSPGHVLVAWTDNDSTTQGISNLSDGHNTWTKVMPSGGWKTAASPVEFDTVFITTNTTSSALSFVATCEESYEIAIADFTSSVGTVTVDCFSAWRAFDVGSSSMTTNCTSSHTNDVGMGFADWDSVNPTPCVGWTPGTTDTEVVFEFQQQTTAGTVTGCWGGSSGPYATSTVVIDDGGGGGGSVPAGTGGPATIGGNAKVGE